MNTSLSATLQHLLDLVKLCYHFHCYLLRQFIRKNSLYNGSPLLIILMMNIHKTNTTSHLHGLMAVCHCVLS